VKSAALVPAYNESEIIGSVIEGVSDHVNDVIVVDDASTDDTAEIARQSGAIVIIHAVNTGVGGALRTGYRYAIGREYDVVVQIDGDDQHDPTYVPEMLAAVEDADVVIGSRYLNDSCKDHSRIRQAGIRFFTELVNALGGVEITDVTSGFRVYRVNVLREILHSSDDHWAVEQTLETARKGYRLQEISTEMPTRTTGRSQFTLDTFLFYPIRMTEVLLRVLIFR
jgi:glycosyltransferase involved in cell wall biosynthesis